MRTHFIAAFAVLVFLCSLVEARPVGVWSYQLLVEQSDLVLIGNVDATRAFDEKLEKSPFSDILDGRLTIFKVESRVFRKIGGPLILGRGAQPMEKSAYAPPVPAP